MENQRLRHLQVDLDKTRTYLQHVLEHQIAEDANQWLTEKLHRIPTGDCGGLFFQAFNTASQIVGNEPLVLDKIQAQDATFFRSGWQLHTWSKADAARTALILAVPYDDQSEYLNFLESAFSTADEQELVALYQALQLLPYPNQLQNRAAEGVRSNMNSVVEAIALRNPYPAEFLSDEAFNQLVLKIIFIGRPVALISGLDRRITPALAAMVLDFVKERHAAHRSINPLLVQWIAPYFTDSMRAELSAMELWSERN